MAMNEEATITVSEPHTAVVDSDTIVVKEAVEEVPPSRPWQPPMSPQPLPAPKDTERKNLQPEPKTWMETQEAKDFEPFLIMELKRIKPPGACARSHNEAERTLGQYKRLNSRISKALQADDDGVLNIDKIDQLRERVEQHIEVLERMLAAHDEMKKRKRHMRRASDDSLCPKCAAPLWETEDNGAILSCCLACGEDHIVKEAGTPHFLGAQVHVSAFENAITGMLINAVVSGGRDLEQLYAKLKDKYKLDSREELAILQIMEDKGYPVFKDRARIGEDQDPTDPKEPREWQAQYNA